MRYRVPFIALLLATIMSLAIAVDSPPARQAWLVDLGGIHDPKEMYLATALQGIVNRDQPRLFYLTHCEWSRADLLHVDYLEKRKGFSFTRLAGLGEAVRQFVRMGLIKGLVVYDLPEGGWNWGKYGFYGNLAITMAGLQDLLPVTPDVLACRTSLLAEGLAWTQDDMGRGGWGEMFCAGRSDGKGLTIAPFPKQGERPARYGCYRSRWVDLDLAATPVLEVTVDQATGPWDVVVKMGSAAETGQEGLSLAGPSTRTGVCRLDLRKAGLGDPLRGHAELRLCALGQDSSVTFRRLRLLDAQGQVPAIPARQKEDWFAGLPVVEDLRNRFGTDEAAANRWALAELLPKCSKEVAVHSQIWWTNVRSLDYLVARKGFIFCQNRKLYIEPYPYFDEVMRHLSPMAEVLGWGGDESYWVHKVSVLGKREISAFAANLSFWRATPLDRPLQHPRVEQVRGPVRNKHYINFLMSSGDAIGIVAGYQGGAWADAKRGTVPVTWGTNPALVTMAPALMELFANQATPADSFCSGPSGSGYNNPSVYLQHGNLDAFADLTRRDMQQAGLSMAIDFWDYLPGLVHRVIPPFTRPGRHAPIRLLLPWPGSNAAANVWMDDGTPVIFADNTRQDQTWCLWLGLGCSLDHQDPVTDLVGRIQRIAAKHDPPFFISVNIRVPVSILAQVRDRLPQDRFEVVGMPDFERLAREAGSLTVAPDHDMAVGGQVFGITIERRNADGVQGDAGTVGWRLPAGWTAARTSWSHHAVPRGGILRERLLFTPPACTATTPAELVFEDRDLGFIRTVRLDCQPDGRLVTDGRILQGWTVSNGARVAVDGDRIRLMPPQAITSDRFASEIVNGPRIKPPHGQAILDLGTVDFDRLPLLEFEVQERFTGRWSAHLTSRDARKWLDADRVLPGMVRVDLAKATGWKGERPVALEVDPVASWGEDLHIRRVAVFYPSPRR